MEQISLRRKRRTDSGQTDGMRLREKQLRAEISTASVNQSSEYSGRETPDPIGLLSQNYRNTFDLVGREKAAQLAGKERGEDRDAASAREDTAGANTERESVSEDSIAEKRRRHDSPQYSHSGRQLAEGGFCDRFSENAFRGGKLAGAVLAGQGRNMFITCVDRALTVDKASNEKQRKLLGASAFSKKVGGKPASVMANRDVRSAVGIAVDAVQGASRVLDIFRGLAEDPGSFQEDYLEMYGVHTLEKTYPFLRTDSDKALINKYKSRLKTLENDKSADAAQERQSISSALKKAEAILNKKEAEKRNFLTQLSKMQNNAREAEKLFSSEGFAETVLEEIESGQNDVPPDDNRRRRRSLNEVTDNEQGTVTTEQETTTAAEQADAENIRE